MLQSPLERIKNLQPVPEATVRALEMHLKRTYVPAMLAYRKRQAKARERIEKIVLFS